MSILIIFSSVKEKGENQKNNKEMVREFNQHFRITS